MKTWRMYHAKLNEDLLLLFSRNFAVKKVILLSINEVKTNKTKQFMEQ